MFLLTSATLIGSNICPSPVSFSLHYSHFDTEMKQPSAELWPLYHRGLLLFNQNYIVKFLLDLAHSVWMGNFLFVCFFLILNMFVCVSLSGDAFAHRDVHQ